MDFAPYQSSPPEHSRLSSPLTTPRASVETSPFAVPSTNTPGTLSGTLSGTGTGTGTGAHTGRSPPPLQHPQPQRAPRWNGRDLANNTPITSGMPGAFPAEVSEFDTSLGLRLDWEACLAYLAVPPVGAMMLLVLEKNSDYVRFHAWQSALLFTSLMVLHVLFSWSALLGWVFFLGDVGLIGFLTWKAYQDAENLDRYEVPFFGRIASRILDDE